MKKGIAIGAVLLLLVLVLMGSNPDDVIREFDGNPYIDALPSGIDYWLSLINGALIERYGAGEEGVSLNDSALVCAIAWQESGFLPSVISGAQKGGAGEIGLCQILPSTAEALGFSLASLVDPRVNAQAAFSLVREIRLRNSIDPLYANFPASVAIVLGGYNAGIAGEKNPGIVEGYVNQVWDRFEAIQIHAGLIQVITQ